MLIHQQQSDRQADSAFVPGELAYLVPGNRCRLLDGRRTPGVIEAYHPESATFTWRIMAYEDEGKTWTLPAEDVRRFQFKPGGNRLNDAAVAAIEKAVERFQQTLVIEADPATRRVVERAVIYLSGGAKSWLTKHSRFFQGEAALDLNSRQGPPALARDLLRYMEDQGLRDVEERTAENIVLNPRSGELVKGMLIVLAEMGLAEFRGTIPRTPDIFQGETSKAHRKRYLAHRLAFVRAYFQLLDRDEVVLYRGMSTEGAWQNRSRSFLSCTFNLEVARAFAEFERGNKYRHAYLAKMTVPVERLWMTYLETAAMNRQYNEAEALVLARGDLHIHW